MKLRHSRRSSRSESAHAAVAAAAVIAGTPGDDVLRGTAQGGTGCRPVARSDLDDETRR